jgi:hypothetical protein
MKCLYYVAPTLESTRQISEDLHTAGVRDFFVHVIAKDAAGLKHQHIHSANYLETLDIVRDGFIGAAIGVLIGLAVAALLFFIDPFPNAPRIVYFIIVVLVILFGAWEGGLTGIAMENNKIRRFHGDIEAGKYVILIYARKEQGAAVRAMMRAKHKEAQLVAVTKHFVNPFSALRRRHAVHHPEARAENAPTQESARPQ